MLVCMRGAVLTQSCVQAILFVATSLARPHPLGLPMYTVAVLRYQPTHTRYALSVQTQRRMVAAYAHVMSGTALYARQHAVLSGRGTARY